MELNHENMKKIRQLIVFTALLIVCLWQYSIVFDAFRFVFGVLFPFILGGAIAFVVNVPMHFIEEKLFNDARKGRSKAADRKSVV